MAKGDIITLFCHHCGNTSAFEVREEFNNYHPLEIEDYQLLEIEENASEDQHSTWWRLLKCLSCMKPTLEEIFVGINYDWRITFQGEPEYEVSTILYPAAKLDLHKVPWQIQKEYDSALKYRKTDPKACAVYVGRALETLCAKEKIKGKSLHDKLYHLIEAKGIPHSLELALDKMRVTRNIGAHASNNDNVTKEEAELCLDILEALLEYIYIAPAKIASIEARLKSNLPRSDQ